jgi:DNA-binding LacI/PurR family transcriptional regulator
MVTTAKKPLHRRANSQDVAVLAGVSQATVSRAFTPGASVAKRTRQKIVDAAMKLGYHPNVIARSLSKNQSKLIGLLFANWAHPKAAELLKGLSEALMERGYKAVIQSTNASRPVDEVLRDFLQYQVDGVIVFSAAPSSEMSAECFRSRVPVVLLNRQAHALSTSSVFVDARGLGEQIGRALLERSYHRLALISADSNSQVVIDMTNAIKNIVAESSSTEIVAELPNTYGYDAGVEAIHKLWNRQAKPDAVVCTSDYTALGILAGCRYDLGINVPEEMGIIGLGDIPAASWKGQELTTVRLPHDDLVQQTVNALLARVDDPDIEPEAFQFDADLILRGTTRDITND